MECTSSPPQQRRCWSLLLAARAATLAAAMATTTCPRCICKRGEWEGDAGPVRSKIRIKHQNQGPFTGRVCAPLPLEEGHEERAQHQLGRVDEEERRRVVREGRGRLEDGLISRRVWGVCVCRVVRSERQQRTTEGGCGGRVPSQDTGHMHAYLNKGHPQRQRLLRAREGGRHLFIFDAHIHSE